MSITTFKAKAPWIMAMLIRDFHLSELDAAAILGNLGHESGGLATLQEISPTVKGSKGGYGWAQWTGPRRRNYTAYCSRNDLDMASDKANYKFLFVELNGDYAYALAKVKAARTLADKVKAFEMAYERAGVKHYKSRNQWASRAMEAWKAVSGNPTLPAWALDDAAKAAGKPADAQELSSAPEHQKTPNTRPTSVPERPRGNAKAIGAAIILAGAAVGAWLSGAACNIFDIWCGG